MVNINNQGKEDHTYDAIVIGSGMSGGWSAKELAENGLKTLLLERGREVKHNVDYPTTNLQPYELEHRGRVNHKVLAENPIVGRCYAFKEDTEHFFVKDTEHPYIQESPFDWIRGYQTGGRSLLWARQVQRWSDFDFEGPARDGFAVDWPIRYKDVAPWYSHVEKFVGVSGNPDGLESLPDGEFLPPLEMTAMEEYFKNSMAKHYPDRPVIIGRCAHITGNFEYYAQQGRGGCQNRTLCQRGCPFGGYFSSNSSTIPWAMKTGNLSIRHHSVVHSIIYDDEKGKATGVRVIDANTNTATEYFARIIFVNAGSINSNLILLNSTSSRFPQGLGNDNGLLGKYVAFHNYRAGISGEYEGLKEYRTAGRRPTGGYIPRFRNLRQQETDFLRGYAAGLSGHRRIHTDRSGVGQSLKDNLLNPKYGPWGIGSHMMGETIPKESNYVKLDQDKKDQWGIPQARINIQYDDNDEKMIADYLEQMEDMFHRAGITNIRKRDDKRAPGLDIHEMGDVRMGRDPKTSLLNKWNQFHNCPNVFVTDGACMTSTSTQNPSLTYMMLSARAANYAVDELKKMNL